MTEQQTAVRDTGVLTNLQGIIVERQRLLIREANYLRQIIGIPPVRSEDGVIEVTAPAPVRPPESAPDPPPVRRTLHVNYNRPAILRAVAVAIEWGEEPTCSVIRAISGIPERSAARALKWAVEARVLVSRDGAYVPGEAWAARGRAWAEREP